MTADATKPGEEMELSKDQILEELPRQPKKVSLPDRGGFVRITALTGHDIDQLRNRAGQIDERAVLAKLVAFGLCDKEGKRLLKDDDYTVINRRWTVADLKAVAEAIKQVSGITDEDQTEIAHKARVGNS